MAQQDPEYLEKIAAAEASVLAKYGYIKEDGDVDVRAIEDKLLARLVNAEATAATQRGAVAIPRVELMQEVYPGIPGPAEFVEQEDPAVAEFLYGKLSAELWTMLSMNPTGAIQSRLNGEHSLVLCRRKATKHVPESVYVTRNGKCIDEDYWEPEMSALGRVLGKAARKAALVAERVPAHGPKLRRSLKTVANRELESAEGIVTAAIESASASASESDAA
jgi:hypothetical protein